MIKTCLFLCLNLFLTGLLKGAESYGKLQDNKEQWVKEIQLSGTFRLGGKGFASLITPRGNFWVEEGKSSSGYKLIELDTSKSQPPPSSKREISKHGSDFEQELCHAPAKLEPGI